MSPKDKKHIVKKLIREELNEKEEAVLLQSHSVSGAMQKQWEGAPDMARKDRIDGQHLWQIIQQETWLRIPARKVRFYKVYAWVATVAILLGIAGSVTYLISREEPVPMYVVSAGIQNMESVTLPDGSRIQLGPGSRLTYPARFTGKSREITLDGQAFFDVEKDRTKPFIVHTSSMDVEALGTAFELFTYSIENRSEAILLNGKIKVYLIDPQSENRTDVILEPNEKLEYNIRDRKVTSYTVDAEAYTSWRKRGILTFENEKLSMIIPRLEQWFGRKIICEKDIAETYKYTFKVRDESLERILYIMSESSPIRYTKEENGDFTLSLRQ